MRRCLKEKTFFAFFSNNYFYFPLIWSLSIPIPTYFSSLPTLSGFGFSSTHSSSSACDAGHSSASSSSTSSFLSSPSFSSSIFLFVGHLPLSSETKKLERNLARFYHASKHFGLSFRPSHSCPLGDSGLSKRDRCLLSFYFPLSSFSIGFLSKQEKKITRRALEMNARAQEMRAATHQLPTLLLWSTRHQTGRMKGRMSARAPARRMAQEMQTATRLLPPLLRPTSQHPPPQT